MLGAIDDMILQGAIQQAEFLAESGYPHRQAPVTFRMALGIEQGIRIHHVELHVAQALLGGGAHQIRE